MKVKLATFYWILSIGFLWLIFEGIGTCSATNVRQRRERSPYILNMQMPVPPNVFQISMRPPMLAGMMTRLSDMIRRRVQFAYFSRL